MNRGVSSKTYESCLIESRKIIMTWKMEHIDRYFSETKRNIICIVFNNSEKETNN